MHTQNTICIDHKQQQKLRHQGYITLPCLSLHAIEQIQQLYDQHPYEKGARDATFFNTLDQIDKHKYYTAEKIEEIVHKRPPKTLQRLPNYYRLIRGQKSRQK